MKLFTCNKKKNIETSEDACINNGIIKTNWNKHPAACLSIALLIISLLLLIMASPVFETNWNEDYIDYVNNILIGIAVGFLGIIVTILFVQSALDRQTAKNEKIEEYKKIHRYYKYLKILIDEYMVYYNHVVTPIDKPKEDLDKGFIKDFELKDMNGMYINSILIRDGYNTPTIKKFYEAEECLRSYLLRWNEEIDFKYATKLEEIINEFLVKSKELDSRENILGALETSVVGKRLSEIISDELTENKRDYYTEFKEGRLQSNIMTPVVFLYCFLIVQRDCILRLVSEIISIENELKTISE